MLVVIVADDVVSNGLVISLHVVTGVPGTSQTKQHVLRDGSDWTEYHVHD